MPQNEFKTIDNSNDINQLPANGSDATILLQQGLFAGKESKNRMESTASPEKSIAEGESSKVRIVLPTSIHETNSAELAPVLKATSMERLEALQQFDARGYSLLTNAIRSSKTETITELLKEFSSNEQLEALGQLDGLGETALTAAIQYHETKIITLLLSNLSRNDCLKALNQRDRNGMTALTRAVMRYNIEAIKALLKDLRPDEQLEALGQQDGDGNTPLTIAARINGLGANIINALLSGLSPSAQVAALGQPNRGGCLALVQAAALGKIQTIAALLIGLSSEEILTALCQTEKESGGTALIVATRMNKREAIAELLKGLSPDEKQIALACRGQGALCNYTPLDICLNVGVEEQTLMLLTSLQKQFNVDYHPLSESEINRLLHMRFGLQDKAITKEPVLPSHVAYQSLSESLRNYIQGREDKLELVDNQSLANIEKAFSKTNIYRLMSARSVAERIMAGESIVIPTGWLNLKVNLGHETAIVFAKGLVMKCNRGDRPSGKDCGISIFESTATTPSIYLNALTLAIELLRERGGQSNFYERLDEILRLKPVTLNRLEKAFVQRKEQKVGNCVFVSPKTAFAALLFAQFRGTDNFCSAFEIYEKVAAFDRKLHLKKNAIWAKAHPEATRKTARAIQKAQRWGHDNQLDSQTFHV